MIISDPVNASVSVKENATFQCIFLVSNNDCFGRILLWDLNGTTIKNFDIPHYDPHNCTDCPQQCISELIIPINCENRPVLNNGRFTCTAASLYTSTSTDPSEPAILNVQGTYIYTTHINTHVHTHTHTLYE